MKYQAKYTSQGQSRFFADGRSNRLPPEFTIPFDGTDYTADAGRHAEPNPDFLKGDRRYYFGVANADAKTKGADGVEVFDEAAVEGRQARRAKVTTSTTSRRWRLRRPAGGNRSSSAASGSSPCTVRPATGLAAAAAAAKSLSASSARTGCRSRPSNIAAPATQARPDGEFFNTITNGVRTMPAYGHQVKVQDRWAIVAYLRVLQFAAER